MSGEPPAGSRAGLPGLRIGLVVAVVAVVIAGLVAAGSLMSGGDSRTPGTLQTPSASVVAAAATQSAEGPEIDYSSAAPYASPAASAGAGASATPTDAAAQQPRSGADATPAPTPPTAQAPATQAPTATAHAAIPTPTPTPNLATCTGLTNGGFEADGIASGWGIDPNWSVRTDGPNAYVRTGAHSMQAVVASPAAVTYAGSCRFAVTAGRTYVVSGWVTGYAANSAAEVLENIRWYDGTGSTITDDNAGDTVVGTDETWHQFIRGLTAPPAAAYAIIFFAQKATTPGDRIFVDDAGCVAS